MRVLVINQSVSLITYNCNIMQNIYNISQFETKKYVCMCMCLIFILEYMRKFTMRNTEPTWILFRRASVRRNYMWTQLGNYIHLHYIVVHGNMSF